MLFNSIDFAIFLPIVFLLYWFVFGRSIKWQNLLIATASYVFYGWWDWRFLSLILFSTIVDYTIGISLENKESAKTRKIFLYTSLIVNLGLLGFFKYYNFFIDNFKTAFSFFGNEIDTNYLNIILPVGISFYTFQTLSYSIDVYRGHLKPTKNFISFAAFVSFFPQLVAGPIERASNLLPQFNKERRFDYTSAVDGVRQILWGLFKKVVIADNCATYSNYIFENYSHLSGSTLFLGAVFFAFQIYGDFSGYSDIAIGTARLFGFSLMRNFAYPYFSRDIAEFWRRWHISLSTWFRDYLYIPLGGSQGGAGMKVRNTFIIFVVSGFWHGANWTFIIWGALNAAYFLPLLLTNKNRQNMEIVAGKSYLPSFKELGKVLLTFGITVIAWVFFRAENVMKAFYIIKRIFSKSFFSLPYYNGLGLSIITIFFVILFVIAEWISRRKDHPLENINYSMNKISRWALYTIMVVALFVYGNSGKIEFIYFQF